MEQQQPEATFGPTMVEELLRRPGPWTFLSVISPLATVLCMCIEVTHKPLMSRRKGRVWRAWWESLCILLSPHRIWYASHSIPNATIRAFRRGTDQNLHCERYCAQQDISSQPYKIETDLCFQKDTTIKEVFYGTSRCSAYRNINRQWCRLARKSTELRWSVSQARVAYHRKKSRRARTTRSMIQHMILKHSTLTSKARRWKIGWGSIDLSFLSLSSPTTDPWGWIKVDQGIICPIP